MDIDVIIEVPKGTNIKYEKDNDRIRVDRVLQTPHVYPGNYGYVPNTLAGDGDPLDALVVCDYQIMPTAIIKCRIIGVLETQDENGADEKLIVVPATKIDPVYADINEYTDLPQRKLDQIKYFFEHYKDLEPTKWVKVGGYTSADAGYEIVQKYQRNGTPG